MVFVKCYLIRITVLKRTLLPSMDNLIYYGKDNKLFAKEKAGRKI